MSNWTDTLAARGAHFDQQLTTVEANDTEKGCIVPLLHQRALMISGPDTDKFLQGQLTCDVAHARSQGSALGAHCNVKGHMISLFRLIATEEGFLLRLHHEIAESAQKALAKYIIFSKAQISQPEGLVGIGLLGPKAAELGRLAVEKVPSEDNAVARKGERLLVRVPGDRFELWLPEADAIALLPDLLEHGKIGSSNNWLMAEIEAGIPDLRASTSEAFIPQMTNLQALEGVSFTKGCYTGQEIVTRLQHRGQLKRPMYRLSVKGAMPPAAGSAIHASGREGVGQVVFAASTPDGCELLAVVLKEAAENDTLHLDSCTGPQAELKPLPYRLDPKLFEKKHTL